MPLLNFLEFCVVSKLASQQSFEVPPQHLVASSRKHLCVTPLCTDVTGIAGGSWHLRVVRVTRAALAALPNQAVWLCEAGALLATSVTLLRPWEPQETSPSLHPSPKVLLPHPS